MMESPYAPPHFDSSRPSLGFPLGTALLLIVIFSSAASSPAATTGTRFVPCAAPSTMISKQETTMNHTSKPKSNHMDLKQKQNESLPVVMPGDRIAKFIAMPCPCQPLRAQKVIVEVEKPVKPQHIVVPLD